jgi:hypothetical protein
MNQPTTPARTDEKLSRLLEIEQGLERRLRDAEEEARRLVESTRAAVARTRAEARAGLDVLARTEEEADLEKHADELRRVETARIERLSKLTAFSEAEVDRLARETLETLLSGREVQP